MRAYLKFVTVLGLNYRRVSEKDGITKYQLCSTHPLEEK